jgi:hypothetical protein
VLAPHPLFPVSRQTFSIGPASLSAAAGAGLPRYPVTASGRVNRQFRDVTADGLIYCYVTDATTATLSFFVRLGAGDVLTISRVTHAAGSTPCSSDPATWSFGAGATNFIR